MAMHQLDGEGMVRRDFLRGSAALLACLSSASLQAALAGGAKTLAIGASRGGCEFALADPENVILMERGILPAIELGAGQTDEWAAKLLDAGCRVLLNAELENIEETDSGFRVTAHGTDGVHVFTVDAVKDFTAHGWRRGEFK